MNSRAKGSLFALALALVAISPATLLAQSSVPDLEFESVTTLNASLLSLNVRSWQLRNSNRVKFSNETLAASIVSGEITFDEIELVKGATTVTVVIEPATLVDDRRGASFSAPATFTIENSAGEVELTGRVRGRVTLRRGTYHLAAAATGLLTVPASFGNGKVYTVAIPLYGTATAETTAE